MPLTLNLSDSTILLRFKQALIRAGFVTDARLEMLYFYYLGRWAEPGGIAVVKALAGFPLATDAAISHSVTNNYSLALLAAALHEVPTNLELLSFAETVPLQHTPAGRPPADYQALGQLLQAAWEKNSVPPIRRLVDAVLFEEDTTQGAGGAETKQGFEARFLPGTYQKPRAWEERKREIERRVCRIVCDKGDGTVAAIGTGFLVGPDLVLTNHHVCYDYRNGAAQPGFPEAFRCQFDLPDGGPRDSAAGTLVPLVGPPLDQDPPRGLDFALLRLTQSIGDDGRGWEDPRRSSVPQPGVVVVVFQHPDGDALRFSAGGVTRQVGNSLYYRANTDPGSSGSPCFEFDLTPVALHHRADAGHQDNGGILLKAITPRIQGFLPATSQ